jgi:hypothetical protein
MTNIIHRIDENLVARMSEYGDLRLLFALKIYSDYEKEHG